MKKVRNVLITLAVMSVILVGALYANRTMNAIREARWEKERESRIQDVSEQTESIKSEIDTISHMDKAEIIEYIEGHAYKEDDTSAAETPSSEKTATESATEGATPEGEDAASDNEDTSSLEEDISDLLDPWSEMDWETGLENKIVSVLESAVEIEEELEEEIHTVYDDLFENENIEVIGENGELAVGHAIDDDGSDNMTVEEVLESTGKKLLSAISPDEEEDDEETLASPKASASAKPSESPEADEDASATPSATAEKDEDASEKPSATDEKDEDVSASPAASPSSDEEAVPSASPEGERNDGWEAGSSKENVNRVAELGYDAVADALNNKSDDQNADGNDSDLEDEGDRLPWEPEITLSHRQKLRSSHVETRLWVQADNILLEKTDVDLSGIKIACIGDSVTAATNLDEEPGYEEYTYPSVLGRTLNAERVTNLGIGGTSLGRYWDQPFCERYQEIPEDTDVIIVFGGYNDGYCLTEDLVGNMEERAPRTLYGDVNDLFAGLKRDYPRAEIIVMTPFPNLLHDVLRKERDFLLPQTVVVNCLLELAYDYDLTVIDNYNSNMLDSHDADIVADYIPDSVHPNKAGYEILGRHVAAEMIRIIKRRTAEVNFDKPTDDIYGDDVTTPTPAASPTKDPSKAEDESDESSKSGKPSASPDGSDEALESGKPSASPGDSSEASESAKPSESPGDSLETSESAKPSESPEASESAKPSVSPDESPKPSASPDREDPLIKRDHDEDEGATDVNSEERDETDEKPKPSRIIIIGRD